MSCPDHGALRTFIDGEVTGEEMLAVARHVQSCGPCHTRAQLIQRRAGSVQEKLAALPGNSAVETRAAYDRYIHAYGEPSARPAGWAAQFVPRWIHPALGGAALAAVLLVVMSFSPARTWAQKILDMLRVQKIAVVPVDLTAINAQSGNGHQQVIAQFISDNVVVTMKPGPAAPASDAAAATQMAGFRVRELESLGTPAKVRVNGEGAFQMTLNRDRIQTVLEQAGRSDVQIPESMDGALVAVHVPKMVRLDYGNCEANDSASASQPCIHFTQVPSPTISVPPGLNLAVLAEAGLQIAGMSAAEAHTFAQTVDWSSTLVIPVPQGGGSYRTVSVDGVNGTLIEYAPHGNFVGRYELMWVKNGIVYSIGGKGTSEQALVAAASLS
ncbi:MAG: zf-HC2 domain-containing protein [Acidobacteriaceae bacterium]|nr:zf-HC2 domain-containing protein [Acidobacteriaceae bacterium]